MFIAPPIPIILLLVGTVASAIVITAAMLGIALAGIGGIAAGMFIEDQFNPEGNIENINVDPGGQYNDYRTMGDQDTDGGGGLFGMDLESMLPLLLIMGLLR